MPKATQEQIDAWKSQFGDVFQIEVDGKYAYLKKPDRKTIAYATSIQQNPIKSDEALLAGCWIWGDEEIKTDNELFLGARRHLPLLLEIKDAELTKL